MLHFLLSIGEWFADIKDNIQLTWLGEKLNHLCLELEDEFNPQYRHQIQLELEMVSEAHNVVLRRIKLREARHQVAAH